MKTKKISAVITTVALIGTVGVTSAFAANNARGDFKKDRPAITDTQKLERTPLTDEQKAEIREQIKARLSQQLADGNITQEQYDEMITAIEEGKMPMGGGMRGREKCGMGAPGRMGNRSDKASADAQ